MIRISRRNLLVAGAGIAAAGMAVRSEDTLSLETTETEVFLGNLHPDLDGYRIGFLSDIHLGAFIPNELVEEAVSRLNTAKVDLVLLGGDYVWIPERSIIEELGCVRNPAFLADPGERIADLIFKILSQLLSPIRAPDGVFAVYGNHDRWTSPTACAAHFKAEGIALLINESRNIWRGHGRLRIDATDDFWTAVPRLPLPWAKSEEETRVLLTHNPDFASFALGHPKYEFDLALCGHTHGGQVSLPLVGALHYNIDDLRLASGLYHGDRAKVFTSRGVGVVEVPVRINCPPEVSVITLRRT